MKKEEYPVLALPFCMCLGMMIGSILGNVTMGIVYGMLAGTLLMALGLTMKSDNEEDKDAE